MQVYLNNYKMDLTGQLVKVGQKAPDFTVTGEDFHPIFLSDFVGAPLIICGFLSVDANVCYEHIKLLLPALLSFDEIPILAITTDLPFAWMRSSLSDAHKHPNVFHSTDYLTRKFALDYGVLIKNGPLAGMITKVLIMLDENHIIQHVQLNPNLLELPDLAPIKNTLHQQNKGSL